MVNVTMDQIIAFRNSGDAFRSQALPLKVAYKLNKLKKVVEVEGEFYSSKFQEIVDKYAKKDDDGNVVFSEDGNQIMIQDGKIEECNEALEDLQKLTVEVDNFNLSIDDFGDNIECAPEDLEALLGNKLSRCLIVALYDLSLVVKIAELTRSFSLPLESISVVPFC